MTSFVLENVQPIDDVATKVKADDDADDGTKFVKAQFDGGIPKTNVLHTRQITVIVTWIVILTFLNAHYA